MTRIFANTKYNENIMGKIIYPEESYKIVGACFNVYNEMGCGFLEAVYQECLELEFEFQGIPFKPQQDIFLSYRQKKLKQTYKPDFLCFDKIIVEIKAVSKLTDEHRSQVINYLNATNFDLALLVNFGHYPKLQNERFALTEHKKKNICENSRHSRAKND
jgi:GxxExxY protein